MQPLLPAFSLQFAVSPATSSLALSVSTFALGIALIIAGPLSERWGRKPLMTGALLTCAIISLLCAAAQSFAQLVALRLVLGVTLSGLPAIAMAYLGEEIEPAALGLAMGLYVGGTALGGMCGRLIVGAIADAAGWRAALAVIGACAVLCAVLFQVLLPPSRHFQPRVMSLRANAGGFLSHLRDRGMLLLYATAFLAMGSFVTVYNYLGYRLEAAPYHLSQTQIGLIFIAYLSGVVASALMGRLADRFGRGNVLWISVTILLIGVTITEARPLWAIIVGVLVLTFGFFGTHSTASGWVSRRAQSAKGLATSLYLLAFYMGSSIVGSAGGTLYSAFRWNGVVIGVDLLIVLALGLALGPLRTLPALSKPSV